MGKQKGEGGRSKNRPSSSSLHASLLPTGVSSAGFGGYLGSSRLESASSSEESVPFSDVDSEVAQHLKRLGRKDPTTKLKALSSLSLLFKQKSSEEIVQIVPQWAFEYKKLLHDYNREVRRATHETMASLVTNIRRGLAPHLKSLMGPWWLSQFDPTPEVSQAARRSFEAAFPASERRLDALMLCVKDIFLYLDENLKLSPQALSDKATPMDELEDMHQRVISSSLLAVTTLIDILLGVKLQHHDNEILGTEQKALSKFRMTTISCAENMFSIHKCFIDFLKSKNPTVRSATYSVLTSYIKHIPHTFNEGNMKVISSAILGSFQEKDASCHSSMWDMILHFSRTFPDSWSHCSIQKVLNRFWLFLRNGCYGSQQISYPVLTQFLESIPLKAVVWEQFIFEFLHNLWAGRNPFHSSAAVSMAFFNAFKQCFLWALHNISRYTSEVDASNYLHVKLINSIFLELLWHDYLLLLPTNNDEISYKRVDGLEVDSQFSDQRSLRELNSSYPFSYLQELGKCIIGVLSDISLKEYDLLNAFCTSFRRDCLEIIQQGEHLQKFHEHIEQVVCFFRLLDLLVLPKGQTWPLDFLARPLITDSFPVIRSMDTPAVVTLLSVLAEIFGPVTIFSYIETNDNKEKFNMDDFLQTFNNDLVPWCLDGNNHTSNSKLDLLISLIQEEYFFEQWCSIITYATKHQIYSESDIQTSDRFDKLELLALLLEKVTDRIVSKKVGNLQKNGSLPEHWRHDMLDSAAIYITRHFPSRGCSAQFLRAALGASSQDHQICYLSREAVMIIFGEIMKNLVLVLSASSFEWAKFSCSLLLPSESEYLMHSKEPSFLIKYELAQFSFEVLEGSIFSLKILDEECTLVPSILAVLFIIDWEASMALVSGEDNDLESCKDDGDPYAYASASGVIRDHSQEQGFLKLTLGRRIHAFRHKISMAFWGSLSSSIVARLGNILVQTVRYAVFEMNDLSPDRVSALCSQWVVEMLMTICHNHTESQCLLDQLFSEGKSWPFWAKPLFHLETRSASVSFDSVHIDYSLDELRHHQFVSFVDKLISSIGMGKVIAGVPDISLSVASASTEVAPSYSSFSRAWLAAEILCTWKWQGGTALSSFLPSLITYVKSEASSDETNIVPSIVDILLDGTLHHGASSQWIFFNAWCLSDDEVEKIQDPYLRALISVLLTLNVKDNIWRKPDAAVFFKRVMDKLFITETVNRNCLRVLPFVLTIIIQPLLEISELDQADNDVPLVPPTNDLLNVILSWLQTAISCLSSGDPSQQDLEEWVQVVLSCYPLRVIGGFGKLGVELKRDISSVERSLLLNLFRKYQKFYSDAVAPVQSSNGRIILSKSTHMTIAKLTAVLTSYCLPEFEENDWTFVLDRSHKGIESFVLLMEEMTENIDDAVINYQVTAELGITLEKLNLAVRALDPLAINIANASLIIHCVLSQKLELQDADDFKNLWPSNLGKWADVKSRLMGNILRIFLATGVAEAIASSCCEEASSIIASSRLAYSQFWGLVASFVNSSPHHVRSSAVESMELWGLSKGSVSSLYAILFSPQPISSLQFAAYTLLTSEPICPISLVKGSCSEGTGVAIQESDILHNVESSSEESFLLRDEISYMIQKPTAELLEMDLLAQDRVNFFVAWAVLLSHLHSLPPSIAREKLVQYIQDSVSSAILDCIFQHIPLKPGTMNAKKKDAELASEASNAANASKHSISTCSVLLYVESLWPAGPENMASLAGSIYGMMIRLLPSYVRSWFTSLRDRSLSSAIESFTKAWCSPPLILDELSKVKETIVADENFSVSVNRSAYEIVATYKKEETGMDLVIRLPSCYPLRPVDVECTRSLGISEVKQRKWLLSLTAFIRNQNGAIAEAIRIWKSNFDKEFEGVEECPICYSIIHTNNHSLPRLACKTCKHKFHSACLYKWFSTSHKSTCPLCQTPF
ncbi:E3 ubiquitin-protein ligase listerin [Typha angustifolia]|uniref:E3 ubiquitin-protein ligase listerin n=1 Tax=Typha angustifolia TaxID=59011 RepID=UPI003C2E2D6C